MDEIIMCTVRLYHDRKTIITVPVAGYTMAKRPW